MNELSKYIIDYKTALYRRNNLGKPCIWCILDKNVGIVTDKPYITIFHGLLKGSPVREVIYTKRDLDAEANTRINAKRKEGYMYLNEVKDDITLPDASQLYDFLDKYLPYDRSTSDGLLLAMKAKTYDNTNNKVFNNCPTYIGQYKINGERCFVRAKKSNDLFKNYSLTFQSRQGTIWTSLNCLEDYLLSVLPNELLDRMIEEDLALDGEVYLPGYSINMINSFIKNPTLMENKLLQFWCYDIAGKDYIQYSRLEILSPYFRHDDRYNCVFDTKEKHLSNTSRFIILPNYTVESNEDAVSMRDRFINNGFEGLILRNPDSYYQFGSRNYAMIKFKHHTDGVFTIVDIVSEGVRRPDVGLIRVKNDINDEVFEVHLSDTIEKQKELLKNRNNYIGKSLFIEFGERSGVKNVPFHVCNVRFNN